MEGSTNLPVTPDRPVRLFTPADAQALVPRLAAILRRTDSKVAEIRELEDLLADSDAYWGGQRNPMPPEEERVYAQTTVRLEKARASLERDLDEIRSLGCELKDLNQGLIDFPAIIEGALAYLCWQRGEERLGFWHSLEGGFVGRKPLPSEAQAER
jgi:hypothetical protein